MPYSVIGAIGNMSVREGTSCPNPCAMMTLNNCVMLCGDWTVEDNDPDVDIAVLPRQAMFPRNPMRVPVMVETEFNGSSCYVNTYLTVTAEGGLRCPVPGKITVLSNGLVINVNDVYYNQEIGNTSGNGTSPLTNQ